MSGEKKYNEAVLVEELKRMVQRAADENRYLYSQYHKAQREILELQREIVRLHEKVHDAKPVSGE